MGKILIMIGLFIVGAGVVLFTLEKFGIKTFPGDLVFKIGGANVYFPIVTSIIISIVLTIILNLFFRR